MTSKSAVALPHERSPARKNRTLKRIADSATMRWVRPDKDEQGHDPNVGYGRVCLYPVPKLNIFSRYGALHVWPTATVLKFKSGIERPIDAD